MVGRVAHVVLVALVAAACTGERPSSDAVATTTSADPPAPPVPTTDPAPSYASEVYADPASWLCWPGRAGDACDIDLTVTTIGRDGTRRIEEFEAADDPPVDCFYVYPTVSDDPTPNSDLEPGDGERLAVRAQAARLAASCRLYAPMYRQITRAALLGQADGIPDRGLAFADVADAWRHYLANHNHGRGVVLVGHSQGAGHLRELISRHVDPDPDARELLVSALLLGTTVRTPRGSDLGAHFEHIPPCRSPRQIGCVVSYSTYPDDAPPGDSGFFAGVRDTPDERAVCTNPAALPGGRAPLDSIMPTHPLRDGDVATPFVRYVGLAEGECVEAGIFHYLEVRYTSGPDDQWPAELGGRISQEWGLHLIDAGVALGDLVALVAEQGRAHAGTR
jgi:hypothetical protein